MSFVVTVDGPAASGKTSVSRELANRLGWKWVSTGAFYRGLAFAAHKLGIPGSDSEALVNLATSDVWSIELSPQATRVIFQGQDVTQDVLQEAVGNMASQISQIPEVRAQLLLPQRSCLKNEPGLVAEGRDCGTVVFPDAKVKVYLTADSTSRAQRRANEKGEELQGILELQKSRDRADSSRPVAPMKVADGALVLDTSHLTLAEVVDRIETEVRGKLSK